MINRVAKLKTIKYTATAIITALLLILTLTTAIGCTPDNRAYVNSDVPINVSVTGGSLSSNVTVVNTPLPVDTAQSIPYFVGIAEGEITGHSQIDKLSFNAAVGTTQEDIWGGSTTYVFPTVAQQMQVVSSAAGDTANGTGVQKVIIYYLDATYNPHSEIVTLNGTTAVNTVNTDIYRINNFRAYTVGATGQSAGNIVVRNLAGTPNYTYMYAGFTRARSSIYTVPAGKTLYIIDFYAGVGGLNATNMCRVILRANYDSLSGAMLPAGVFFMPYAEIVCPNGSVDRQLTIPIKFGAGTDIKVSAYTDSGSAYVEATYRGWIE